MNLPQGIKALPNGQWVLEQDTHLSRWAEEHGSIITDPHLFAWLKPHLEGVKVAWDIGAAIGDTTRQYLNWGMKVIAFEPNPLAFACLQWNCAEAHCLNIAASDTNGILRFTQSDNVGASRIAKDGTLIVQASAIDDIEGLPAPGFIKLDIEGWEGSAITGMAGTITRHKPIIFCEINRGALKANGVSPEALHDTIRSLGYPRFELYPRGADWDWPQFDVLYLP